VRAPACEDARINFTLHFHLARRDLGAPAAAVGAMLPDLWRMADRHVRPARDAVTCGGSARVSEVLEGIVHHERADRAFHACAPFHEGERTMTRALATVGAPRLSLFGHIATELCLDGALVRRDATIARDVSDALAGPCAAVDGESPLHVAARIHHAARKNEPLPPPFESRMGRVLHELARGSWIEGYGRGSVVADRLDGIRARLGFAAMSPDGKATLGALLDDAIERADAMLDAILTLRV
jgi:hypothetical protein